MILQFGCGQQPQERPSKMNGPPNNLNCWKADVIFEIRCPGSGVDDDPAACFRIATELPLCADHLENRRNGILLFIVGSAVGNFSDFLANLFWTHQRDRDHNN